MGIRKSGEDRFGNSRQRRTDDRSEELLQGLLIEALGSYSADTGTNRNGAALRNKNQGTEMFETMTGKIRPKSTVAQGRVIDNRRHETKFSGLDDPYCLFWAESERAASQNDLIPCKVVFHNED
jgi:hypothetical protein